MNNRYATIGVLVISCGPLLAQKLSIDAAMHSSDKSYILATGEATISAKPDQAVIDIGVVTQGTTASLAAVQNAKQTDAVLADIRKLIATDDQLKTTGYSVRPNYPAPKPGATATISGYTATNTVEVTLNNLTLIGGVIDATLLSGANNIQKLQFGLKNPQVARSQALRDAAAQAKASAESIAAGLGVQVLRVMSAEEYQPEDGFAMPKRAVAFATTGAPPTQVEAGTIDVSITVMLRVEIGQ